MDFRGIVEVFRDALKYIIVALVILLLFIFVLGFQQVRGPSMEPTFHEGEIVLMNKLIYKFNKISRRDVVVVSVNDKYMIKRVIGLPGETVEYKDNKLYINGVRYEEDFIDTSKVTTEDFTTNGVIPEGKYLVLGDNRENSQDSRDYGFISKKDIIGKSWIRIWPLNKLRIF